MRGLVLSFLLPLCCSLHAQPGWLSDIIWGKDSSASDKGVDTTKEVSAAVQEVEPQKAQATEAKKAESNADQSAFGAALITYAAFKGIGVFANNEQKKLSENVAQLECDKVSACRQLDNCCLKNVQAPRTEHGVPLPCQKEAAKLALYADAETVDKKISDFNNSAPAPTQTREEYEAKEKEKPKEEPKHGWFW
jgi:hypothetical protein